MSDAMLSKERLMSCERRVYSQNGEDGVIEALFDVLGTTNKFFVEIGAGSGSENNTRLLRENGWSGVMLDRNFEGCGVVRQLVTAENVEFVLHKNKVPIQFDLLSIDVDGNDYWIWSAITSFRPRVVVIEYNGVLPLLPPRTISYMPEFRWSGTDYFGASLGALVELGFKKRYTLVYCESVGVNAFFVDNEILPAVCPILSVGRLYAPLQYKLPHDERRMIDPFVENSPGPALDGCRA